jgi:Rrf2 family iron-sulfur cluster assembly transcriptional regulator
VRGPRGGYELARERRRITAGEIVRAAMATSEDQSAPVPESKLVETIIGPAVQEAGEAFLTKLDAVTVEELCRRAEGRAVFSDVSIAADFAI